MIFTIPIRTQSDANLREHWAAKAKRVQIQREAVAWCWLALPLAGRWNVKNQLAAGLVITLTRIASRDLDDDNLVRSMKAVRDEIAKQLGIDDRSMLVKWQYAQERGNQPKEYAVKVEIRKA